MTQVDRYLANSAFPVHGLTDDHSSAAAHDTGRVEQQQHRDGMTLLVVMSVEYTTGEANAKAIGNVVIQAPRIVLSFITL